MGQPKPSIVALRSVPDFVKPKSIFDLVNFSIFELIGVSGTLVTRLCEGEFGVTREEWQFIAMLAHLGPISPSDLASSTTVDRSQTSKSLRGLVEKKLVYRRTQTTDRRRAEVGLTAAGQRMFDRIFPRVVQVHHRILDGLSDADKQRFSECLCTMYGNVQRDFASLLQGSTADRRHGGSRATWVTPQEEISDH